MNERTHKAEALFHAVMEMEATAERERHLDAACGTDLELRREVEAFLSAARAAEPLFRAARVAAETSRVTEQPGDPIGRYKLLEKLGAGGCGVVYVAEQLDPVRRRVALKVIKLGMDTRAVIARFEAERQALAMMDHPNIARVLDAGATDAGRPFFVMELVRGIPITEYCNQVKLPMRQRLELFTQVCSAIQHAHQKGVIHRDIKPSNVLVTLNDGVPLTKVIDFGIAKATEGRLTDATLYTELHQFLGTPAYMSPEQAEMSALDIDTRSDIFSLGVLLYELLTGGTPFDAGDLMRAGFDEMRRKIREEEPERPSTRLSTMVTTDLTTVASQRQAEAPKLVSQLRGDLDWIVMKCLEKDRTRRYESASGLAADVAHHLKNEPVSARPLSAAYRFRKLVRRNKLAVAASAGVAVSVLGGLVISTISLANERQARARAATAEQISRTEAARAEAMAEESRQRLRRLLVSNGARSMEDGNLMNALPWLVEAFKIDQNHPENEAHHRLRIATTFERCPRPRQMWFMPAEAGDMVVSSDRKRVLAGCQDGSVSMWDVETGHELGSVHFSALGGGIARLGFSANGEFAFIEGPRTAVLWDTRTLPQRPPEIQSGDLANSELSPNGKFYVTTTTDGRLSVWDAATAQGPRVLTKKSATLKFQAFLPEADLKALFSLEVSAEAQILLAVGEGGSVEFWDVVTGRIVHERPLSDFPSPNQIVRGTFSCDGRYLALSLDAYGGFHCLLWEIATGRLIGKLPQEHHINDAEFSRDGATLVTCGYNRTVRVWDTATGQLRFGALQHDKPVKSLAISPSGHLLVTRRDNDAVLLQWDLYTGEPAGPPLIHSARVRRMTFADDATLVSTDADGVVRVWDLAAAPRWLWRPDLSAFTTFDLSGSPAINEGKGEIISPDGKLRMVAGRDDAGLNFSQVQDAKTGQEVGPRLTHPGRVRAAQFSQDGRRLLLSTWEDRHARVWDALTGRPLSPIMESPIPLESVAFGPGDRSVLGAGEGGVLRLWDAATAEPLLPPFRHGRFAGSGGIFLQRAQLLEQGRVLGGFCGEARYWAIPQDTRPLALWEHAAQLLSGQRVGKDGNLEALDRETVKTLWQSLRMEAPEDFGQSAQRRYDWNIWRAEVASGGEDLAGFSTARPHLNELIAAEPDRFRFRWLRARRNEYFQDWRGMAEDLRVCLRVGLRNLRPETLLLGDPDAGGPPEPVLWMRIAAAELASGNESGFQEAAREAVGSMTERTSVRTVAKCARVLCHGKVDPATAAALRARLTKFGAEIEAMPRDSGSKERGPAWDYYRSLGPLYYREGKFTEALEALSKTGSSHIVYCMQAMAHQARNNHAAAQSSLERALARWRQGVDPTQILWFEYPAVIGITARLTREAETVVNQERPPPEAEGNPAERR